MDPGQSIVILFGSMGIIGAVVARMWFSHEERKMKLRSQGSNTAEVDALRSEIEGLRAEVARLRDTSTQYDISIQHTLEDMQQRLERAEGRRGSSSPATRADEPAQETIGLRAG